MTSHIIKDDYVQMGLKNKDREKMYS